MLTTILLILALLSFCSILIFGYIFYRKIKRYFLILEGIQETPTDKPSMIPLYEVSEKWSVEDLSQFLESAHNLKEKANKEIIDSENLLKDDLMFVYAQIIKTVFKELELRKTLVWEDVKTIQKEVSEKIKNLKKIEKTDRTTLGELKVQHPFKYSPPGTPFVSK